MTSLLEQVGADPTPARVPAGRAGGSQAGTGAEEAGSGLAAVLSSSVQGQNAAVEAVVRAVTIANARLVPAGRPLANLLFLGPTGVGKTQMVRSLAGAIRTGEEDYCRVDMSSLAQEHYASSITGAPPGYSGSKEGFSVFDRGKIESSPGMPGIVLFDEIEKAHATVVRALLHILDNGFLRLANGHETISFRNCIVVMTSNLGAAELARFRRNRAAGLAAAAVDRLFSTDRAPALQRQHNEWLRRNESRILDRALNSFFDPEFLNRVDEVVRFDGIGRDVAHSLVRAEIADLVRRLRRRYVELSVDEKALAHLAAKGFSTEYGARALQRIIRTELLSPLAVWMADEQPSSSKPLKVLANQTGSGITCCTIP
ncbi:AAA family ATPase [Arthrobacter sp.]|uniref:AAA family ATPase n=1 Tax=Arthrobacter sp. TaxID=1667 RepID=UPI003396A68E